MSQEEKETLSGVSHEWEQRKDETGIAFAAFKIFRDMGLTRTVSEAYRQKTGRKSAKMASGQWLQWARRFEWYTRAEAFDRYLEALERRTEDAAFAENRREWIKRRNEIQNSAWSLADDLFNKAKEILALPVSRTVKRTETKDDGKTTIIQNITEPLRVTLGDGIRAAEMSDKLKRLAANMATERIVTKSAVAEKAELLEDARAAFREARDLYRETETVETTARNIAAAYALDTNQLLEGYDDSAPLASNANN